MASLNSCRASISMLSHWFLCKNTDCSAVLESLLQQAYWGHSGPRLLPQPKGSSGLPWLSEDTSFSSWSQWGHVWGMSYHFPHDQKHSLIYIKVKWKYISLFTHLKKPTVVVISVHRRHSLKKWKNILEQCDYREVNSAWSLCLSLSQHPDDLLHAPSWHILCQGSSLDCILQRTCPW